MKSKDRLAKTAELLFENTILSYVGPLDDHGYNVGGILSRILYIASIIVGERYAPTPAEKKEIQQIIQILHI